MKKIFLWSFVLVIQTSFSQMKFPLDYALEFEIMNFTDKNRKIPNHYYFYNSSNNSYLMNLKEKDSLNFEIYFSDREKLYLISKMNKADFFIAETIENPCGSVRKYHNPFKYQVDNYEFVNLNDTLINAKSYYHYCIRSNRSLKYQKRKKIAAIHYIVDKNSPEFQPFLIEQTCYEEWKKERNIPNGSPFIIYHVNVKGAITFKMQLKSLVKINKYLAVSEECDYTKIE
jgi:hypothetical protein